MVMLAAASNAFQLWRMAQCEGDIGGRHGYTRYLERLRSTGSFKTFIEHAARKMLELNGSSPEVVQLQHQHQCQHQCQHR